jgi:hypothetical protein
MAGSLALEQVGWYERDDYLSPVSVFDADEVAAFRSVAAIQPEWLNQFAYLAGLRRGCAPCLS